jgi:hypothetical protein
MSRLSFSGCLVTAFLCLLSCPGSPVVVVLPQQCCGVCTVLAVLHWLYVIFCLSYNKIVLSKLPCKNVWFELSNAYDTSIYVPMLIRFYRTVHIFKCWRKLFYHCFSEVNKKFNTCWSKPGCKIRILDNCSGSGSGTMMMIRAYPGSWSLAET